MSTCTKHQRRTTNMNSSSSSRTDGEDTVTNKRKRCDNGNSVDEVGEQVGEMLGETDSETSLSTLPDTVLLHIFSFILSQDKAYNPRQLVGYYCFEREQFRLHLALEKTCRRFSAFLGKDSTMRLLYQHFEEQLAIGFSYQVETMREKLFIINGLRMVKQYQTSRGNKICKYMGGADGVRRVIDKILMTKMERPCERLEAYAEYGSVSADILRPPSSPENGFKLFLRGDSIAYLTEVVEQHMDRRLHDAWNATIFRSNPMGNESNPYPMLCERDIEFVDSLRSADFSAFHSCRICRGRHAHFCTRLSFSDSPKIWEWPEDNCLEDDILGDEQRQRMVRAIASRAGIVKLTGSVFDSIAAEILHFMATIVIDAFEVSKSLWCPGANGDSRDSGGIVTTALIDDEIIGEESNDVSEQSYLQYDYITNHPPPPPPELDEDGKYVCVIIPRQIKDAAVRLGMKPLLDDQRWEVSEGRTKKEEMNEALSMYGLSSLDDDSSSEVGSDGESVWQPNSADESDSDSGSEEWSSSDEADIDM